MPAGPKIQAEVREIIAEEALKNPQLQRKEVIVRIEERLKDQGLRIPAFTTLVKLISESRQISEDDKPWSFSADDEIPYETRGTLLKLQRWCLIMGPPLTIREARWASRLVDAMDDRRYLLEVAWRYSVRERIKAAYDELDMDLCFPRYSPTGDNKKNAAAKVGITRRVSIEDMQLLEEPVPDFDLKSPMWIERAMQIPLDKAIERKILGYEIEHVEELPDDLKELYALWLRYCAQLQYWETLDQDAKIMLAQGLHREVADYGKVDEDERNRDWEPSHKLLSKLYHDQQGQ